MSQAERRITIAVVVLPFAAFCLALWLLWGGLVTARDLCILAVMYQLAGFGITVGFHRLLSHPSFDAPGWVRGTLAVLGSMAAQGALIHWVAHHRKHHAFADEDGDPHSPHTTHIPGWRGVIRGVWHAHIGWLFNTDQYASARRYAPDLRADPTVSLIDRLFLAWVLLGLLMPFLTGLLGIRRERARWPHCAPLGRAGPDLSLPPWHLERELDLSLLRQTPVPDAR